METSFMDVTVPGLPTGFRFNPTAEELILSYLIPRRNGNLSIIRDVDLYGNLDPWTLFHVTDSSEKHCFYVFTELKKKETQKCLSKNFIRTSGSGTWYGRNRHKVYDAQGKVIAMNRYYTFLLVDDNQQHGRWTMHEFSLADDRGNSVDGIVVCAIGCNTNISIDTFDPKKINNRNLSIPIQISLSNDKCTTSTEIGFEEKLDNNNCFDECQIISKKRKSASVAFEFEEKIYNDECFGYCDRNAKKRKVQELDTSDDVFTTLFHIDMKETVDASIKTNCFILDQVAESLELSPTKEVPSKSFTELS